MHKFLATTAVCMAMALPATAGQFVQLNNADLFAIQQQVMREVRDPTSLIWGGVRAATGEAAGMVLVCGIVNGKNAYGAYTGDAAYFGALFKTQSGGSAFTVIGIGNDATAQQCRMNGLL